MKSFILGCSTLLALAGAPVKANAQTQGSFSDLEAVTPTAGPEWNQDSADSPLVAPEAAPQPAPSFGYAGPHPIPYDQGGGFCQQTGAHEHPYPVFDRNLFHVANGYAYFVGDPADFGAQIQAYAYRADHPIEAGYGGGFCYMHWPHRHWFAPAVAAGFAWDGGAYAYAGAWAPDYYVQRPFYVNYFNSYYRRYYLGGGYYYRRPAPIYGGWGWHRPVYGSPWYRPPVYARPWARPGYVAPPVYRAPAPYYRAPAPVYRSPAYGVSAPVYRAPAPVYRSPAYGVSAPAYRAPAYYRAPAPAFHAPAYRAPAFHGQAPGWHGGHFRR